MNYGDGRDSGTHAISVSRIKFPRLRSKECFNAVKRLEPVLDVFSCSYFNTSINVSSRKYTETCVNTTPRLD